MTLKGFTFAGGGSGGGGAVSDATGAAKGILQLAGDLAGTAAAPTVPLKPARFGGSTATAAVLPFANVKDYGAVGDGTTDDTTAIQAAITAANGVSEVRFPPGTYKTTTVLTLPASTRLIGAGYLSRLVTADAVKINGDNCQIIDLRFSDNTSSTHLGVQIDNTVSRSGVVIRGCTFDGYDQAIYVNRTQNGTVSERWQITGNTFTDCHLSLFLLTANRVTFANNVSTSTLTTAQHVVIYGGVENKIIANQITFGITGVLFLCRPDIGTDANPMLRNVVANNVIRDMSEEGISFDINASTAATTGAVEVDTVATKPGSSQVTLTAAGWSGAGGRYAGYYMTFLTGALKGDCVKITAESAGTFTLATTAAQYTALTAGDTVSIVLPFLHNTITGNVVDSSTRGTTTAITLYGACYYNTVVGNTCIGKDLSVRSLTGLVKPTVNITNTFGVALCESNTVTGNTVLNADVTLTFVEYGSATTYTANGSSVVGNVARGGKLALIRQVLTGNGNISEVAPDFTSTTGITYVDDSANLKFQGASGVVTTLAPAGAAATLPQLYGLNGTSGCKAATYDRVSVGSTQSAGAATSGTLRLFLIPLPSGLVIANLKFWAGTTAGASLTHAWAGVFDASRNKLAVSADDTTATWTAGTSRTFAVSYTVPSTGAYYVGLLIAGTTIPTIEATSGAAGLLTVGARNAAPITGGNADAGLSTPATCPATAAAISILGQVAYCEIS